MKYLVSTITFLIGMLLAINASAQQNAVHGNVQGNRIYMSVNPEALKANLDTLFTNNASTQSALNNLTWSDVLGNGTTPGMDVDFFGYNASGLGQVTTTGTFTGDSLVLNKDAAITGRLSVTDVVSLGDSLAVTGVVDFADSLRVVKAVSIGQRLYVTGITALGDSMHVVGNVDFDAMFNVDGAATFGSSLAVTGKTTLNDSLIVNSGVTISNTLTADSISVTDVINGQVKDISNHDTDDLTEGSTNQYFTQARARGSVSGSTGVTYDSSTGAISIGQAVGTTDNVSFGTIGGSNITASGTLTADSISVTDVINGQVKDISNHDTDDLTEGSTNQYFTQARARGSVSGSTGVTYDSSTGAISIGQAVGTTDDVTFDDLTADSLITSALRVQDGNQAAGKVLTADANGNASWQDAATTLSAGTGIDITADVVSIGQAVGTTDDVTFDDLTADSLITSALRVQDGNQAAGKVLTADANGNASWQDAATSLSAGTGVDITDGVVSIGQAVGTTDDVTFNNMTADSLNVDVFIYTDGSEGTNKVLQSDVNGRASWVSMPQSSEFNPSKVVIGELVNAPNVPSNTGDYNTGSFIDLPPGDWYVQATSLISSDAVWGPNGNHSNSSIWVRSKFSTSSTSYVAATTVGSNTISGSQVWPANYGLASGSVFIRNDSTAVQRYYWWSGNNAVVSANPAGTLFGFGGSQWGENSLIAISIEEYVDTTPPTMTIAASEVSNGSTSSDATLSLTFTSSEITTDFAESDIAVTNGTLSNFTATSETVFTATFTPTADGVCTINVSAGAFTDHTGNINDAADEFNWTLDTTGPVMTITASEVSDDDSSGDATLSLTFTSSEITTDFAESDIAVTNGTLSNFTATSETVYTATFTPTSLGACTINVAAGAFTDPTGNINAAADEFNWTFVPPTMTITYTKSNDCGSSVGTTLNITFTSSESTTDFTEGDVTVTNGTLSDFAGSGTTYTATFTPTAEGASTINVAGSAFTNAAGTDNVAADEVNYTFGAVATFNSCGDELGYGGYNYATVEIGSQCWFAENLRVENYTDGTPIPDGLDFATWSTTPNGAMTVYDEGGPDEACNLAYYGRLYNYYAVSTDNLCPTGWHVSTDDDWVTLVSNYGGVGDATAATPLKATASDSPAWNGTNTSGFRAVPGAARYSDENFLYGGEEANFWALGSTDNGGIVSYDIYSLENWDGVQRSTWWTANDGFSVRCVRSIEPITQANISSAVNLWTSDQSLALDTYGHISDWNTENVTDMAGLFNGSSQFDQDISGWDVSNVTNMSNMFAYAPSFNQNIGGWDVSNVTDMSGMFNNAHTFNQDIGGWDVSSVTNMQSMFFSALAFDQNIVGWDVGNVKDMHYMFMLAAAFNQNISGWDVSSVTDMNYMFAYAPSFNQNIGGWDVSSVTDMQGMFSETDTFNQNIGGWDVSSVTNMRYMFMLAPAFNQNIGGWDVSSVTNMENMFYHADAFNQNIGGWDVSSVTNMDHMFMDAAAFNQNIGGWDVSSVTIMDFMFQNSGFNQDLSSWCVGLIASEPVYFANTNGTNPVWGTCPSCSCVGGSATNQTDCEDNEGGIWTCN